MLAWYKCKVSVSAHGCADRTTQVHPASNYILHTAGTAVCCAVLCERFYDVIRYAQVLDLIASQVHLAQFNEFITISISMNDCTERTVHKIINGLQCTIVCITAAELNQYGTADYSTENNAENSDRLVCMCGMSGVVEQCSAVQQSGQGKVQSIPAARSKDNGSYQTAEHTDVSRDSSGRELCGALCRGANTARHCTAWQGRQPARWIEPLAGAHGTEVTYHSWRRVSMSAS